MTLANASSRKQSKNKAGNLIETYRKLSQDLAGLTFGPPVTHVYNPLEYARNPAEQFLKLASLGKNRVVLLGMNPGPWGMAQTGVPFGTVSMVRDWLGIQGPVGKPAKENQKRPVLGFGVEREEVSGARFWGWARDRFRSPEDFFDHFFVANYCPLVFMENSGKNRTPDKLPVIEKKVLFEKCDRALKQVITTVAPELIIGVGKFAEDRARFALKGLEIPIGRILHPSPASPIANRGWAAQAEKQLSDLGLKVL